MYPGMTSGALDIKGRYLYTEPTCTAVIIVYFCIFCFDKMHYFHDIKDSCGQFSDSQFGDFCTAKNWEGTDRETFCVSFNEKTIESNSAFSVSIILFVGRTNEVINKITYFCCYFGCNFWTLQATLMQQNSSGYTDATELERHIQLSFVCKINK